MQKNDLYNCRGADRAGLGDCECAEARRPAVDKRCAERDARACPLVERPQYVRCGCGAPEREPSMGLYGYPLASVYAPLQEWRDIYDTETALKRGTVFKELDLPFYGGCCDANEGKCGGGRHGR